MELTVENGMIMMSYGLKKTLLLKLASIHLMTASSSFK
jgi:hypothetical protein